MRAQSLAVLHLLACPGLALSGIRLKDDNER